MDRRFAVANDGPQIRGGVQRTGFTLVELLVVITIIGILVALITAAAIGALRTARQTALKFEVDQISAGIEKLKDSTNAYPPNLIVDDDVFTTTAEAPDKPIIESDVLNNLRRYMRQAFPKMKESDDLLKQLAGDASATGEHLRGGMTAAEAAVFWLSGFSLDSEYPISGEGGPSYPGLGVQDDPIESRKWVHEFKVDRLGPRDDTTGYFDASTMRFITYNDPRDPTGAKKRRINFWTYKPDKSSQPVLYFDVSRHPAAVNNMGTITGPYDPPAASDLSGSELHVHALKMRSQSASAGVPIQFANQGKFQVLHTGIDDAWGEEILEKSSAHGVAEQPAPGNDPSVAGNYLLFPTGPFTEEAADTVVNFATQTRIEDAQQ